MALSDVPPSMRDDAVGGLFQERTRLKGASDSPTEVMYAAIEYQANQAVENQPGGAIASLSNTKSKRRSLWKGTKRPSIHHVSSFEQSKEEDLSEPKATTSSASTKAARSISWLGSKARGRKSVPALPSQTPVRDYGTPPPRHASEGFAIPPEFTTEMQSYSPALDSEAGCSTATQPRTRESSYNTSSVAYSSEGSSGSPSVSCGMLRESSGSSESSVASSAASYGAKIVDPTALLSGHFHPERPMYGSSHSFHGSHNFGTLSFHHLKSTESFDEDGRRNSSEYGLLTPICLRQSSRQGLSPAPPRRASKRDSATSSQKKGSRPRARTLSRVPETIAGSPSSKEDGTPQQHRSSPFANGKRFAFLSPGSKACLTPTFGEVEWATTTLSMRRDSPSTISPRTKSSPRFAPSPPMVGACPKAGSPMVRTPSRLAQHNHQRAKSMHSTRQRGHGTDPKPAVPPLPSGCKGGEERRAGPAESELGLGIICA